MKNNLNAEKVDKNNLYDKVEKYKKEITIATLTTCVLVAGLVICKRGLVNLKEIEVVPVLNGAVASDKNNKLFANKAISVPEYVRKLPKGHKHSQSKEELAAKLGYDLLENETVVNAYSYKRQCS